MYNPGNNIPPNDKVVVGYYVPWGQVEPEQINYSLLTHILYGFDEYYDGTRIKKIQQLAAQHGVKSLISIGGWSGSLTFSTIAKDPSLTEEFIQNALHFVRPGGYNLDGIDIDWEFPVWHGNESNERDPNDTANYLILLRKLRDALDREFGPGRKLITAAVRIEPFFDPNRQPMTDVSAFGQVFDFITIMAYDIHGPWSSTTGPNAPFQTDSRDSNTFCFAQSIQSWLRAGFPANKLVGGLAFYGRSSTACVDMLQCPGNIYVPKESRVPKGDKFDTGEGDNCSGVWKYASMREHIIELGGYAKNGWVSQWDQGTQTPWVFNPQTRVFITYDDVNSIGIKVNHAKQWGIRGVMIWEMSMDYNNELTQAANAIRY
ncbi:glycoside hydrolase family 18 protein [Conidiobolus coronatus NRRL 28638]|uniref:Glycoside hydrolase family 18 protein n=1 Tax=Conidiobolus coronatus (strain ATCC 28846 / CBS 209.66 / NRRL 28638) TaxID=796925 RepID=A0A137PG50_CONC2|nr:glycoside hydrolase family 18 protein [Conidiobolus coronatus NRRL 28638]|eukprot:KXN73983.1 glycoside hydrolase family 18 protein [Conidiobolus coronatus NRRL 28638]